MNLRIHLVAIAIIIVLVVTIMQLSKKPEGAADGGIYLIQVNSASWGLNCQDYIRKRQENTPFADQNPLPVRPNNVLSAVSKLCNGKLTCRGEVTETFLGRDPLPTCNKKLTIEYRCFSYDRPWSVEADDNRQFVIDCTPRGNP